MRRCCSRSQVILTPQRKDLNAYPAQVARASPYQASLCRRGSIASQQVILRCFTAFSMTTEEGAPHNADLLFAPPSHPDALGQKDHTSSPGPTSMTYGPSAPL